MVVELESIVGYLPTEVSFTDEYSGRNCKLDLSYKVYVPEPVTTEGKPFQPSGLTLFLVAREKGQYLGGCNVKFHKKGAHPGAYNIPREEHRAASLGPGHTGVFGEAPTLLAVAIQNYFWQSILDISDKLEIDNIHICAKIGSVNYNLAKGLGFVQTSTFEDDDSRAVMTYTVPQNE